MTQQLNRDALKEVGGNNYQWPDKKKIKNKHFKPGLLLKSLKGNQKNCNSIFFPHKSVLPLDVHPSGSKALRFHRACASNEERAERVPLYPALFQHICWTTRDSPGRIRARFTHASFLLLSCQWQSSASRKLWLSSKTPNVSAGPTKTAEDCESDPVLREVNHFSGGYADSVWSVQSGLCNWSANKVWSVSSLIERRSRV